MAESTKDFTVTYAAVTCYKCCILFLVPEHFDETRKHDGREFWCPNGHGQVYRDGEIRRERQKDPDYESQQARLLKLHREEQAEARITELTEKLAAAELMSASVSSKADEPVTPATTTTDAKQTEPENPIHVCPKCKKIYRTQGPYLKHLKVAHGLDPQNVAAEANGNKSK